MQAKVTFAVFAYNQQDYVQAAIEGAFAQDFEPLEIILSDDGSSDRTFAIMQEMAASYRGPHRVIARQEQPNAGSIQHIINVARVAQADLLICAAGDDISHPNRAKALHQAWTASGADGLTSNHDEIDSGGRMLTRNISFPPSADTARLFRHSSIARRTDGVVQSMAGFCAAYPRRFWADMPDPPTKMYVEDGLATVILNLQGATIERVPHSLVAYRLLDTSMSTRDHGAEAAEIERRERKIDFIARDTVNVMDFLFDLARQRGIPIDQATRRELERHRSHAAMVAGFWEAGPINRLSKLAQVRGKRDAAFLLPRLFGRSFFGTVRRILNRGHHAAPQELGSQ